MEVVIAVGNRRSVWVAGLAVLALSWPALEAHAEKERLDVTMQIVEQEDAPPSTVVKTIKLPPSASDTVKERAVFEINTASPLRTDIQNKTHEIGKSVEPAKLLPKEPTKILP